MIMVTPLQAFHIFSKHIVELYQPMDPGVWEVRDVLGEANTETKTACHTGGPTSDPAAWESWVILTEKVLADEKLGKQKPNEILLTREQALKVMECFLETRYWNKNKLAPLNEVIADISYAFKQPNFESTDIWQQWLTCVPEGLKFKEIFDKEYHYRLEKMRQEYWEQHEPSKK